MPDMIYGCAVENGYVAWYTTAFVAGIDHAQAVQAQNAVGAVVEFEAEYSVGGGFILDRV